MKTKLLDQLENLIESKLFNLILMFVHHQMEIEFHKMNSEMKYSSEKANIYKISLIE